MFISIRELWLLAAEQHKEEMAPWLQINIFSHCTNQRRAG